MADLTQIGRPKAGEIKLDSVVQVLADHADDFIRRVQGNLARDGSNASSALSQSIRPEIKIFGVKYNLLITMEEYWEVIDKGRRASGKFPPYSPGPVTVNGLTISGTFPDIAKWIAQKPLNIMAGAKIPKSGATKAWRQRQVKSLAYLVARKQAKESKRGTRFLTKEVDPFVRRLNQDLSKALKKDVVAHIKEIKPKLEAQK